MDADLHLSRRSIDERKPPATSGDADLLRAGRCSSISWCPMLIVLVGMQRAGRARPRSPLCQAASTFAEWRDLAFGSLPVPYPDVSPHGIYVADLKKRRTHRHGVRDRRVLTRRRASPVVRSSRALRGSIWSGRGEKVRGTAPRRGGRDKPRISGESSSQSPATSQQGRLWIVRFIMFDIHAAIPGQLFLGSIALLYES